MYWNEIKKIASAAGFIVGALTLVVNLLRGHTLLHSTYTAILVMILSSILFLICLKTLGNILTTFLVQKKMEAEKEKEIRAKQLAKEKLEELRERRATLEREGSSKIKEKFTQIKTETSLESAQEKVTQKISA